jgi:hypothetical protein
VKPPYISENTQYIKSFKKEDFDIRDTYVRDNTINIKPDANEDLHVIVASGPYMHSGSTQTPILTQLVEQVKAKNAQVLILVTSLN